MKRIKKILLDESLSTAAVYGLLLSLAIAGFILARLAIRSI